MVKRSAVKKLLSKYLDENMVDLVLSYGMWWTVGQRTFYLNIDDSKWVECVLFGVNYCKGTISLSFPDDNMAAQEIDYYSKRLYPFSDRSTYSSLFVDIYNDDDNTWKTKLMTAFDSSLFMNQKVAPLHQYTECNCLQIHTELLDSLLDCSMKRYSNKLYERYIDMDHKEQYLPNKNYINIPKAFLRRRCAGPVVKYHAMFD